MLRRLLHAVLTPRQYYFARRYVTWLRAKAGRSPSNGALDEKALALCGGKKGGFYVEVGAADGLQQSNTLMLEWRHGWRGLLIEPTEFQFRLCRRARGRRNIVERCALSAEPGEIRLARVGLASISLEGGVIEPGQHIEALRTISWDPTASAETVPARPFRDLAGAHGIERVDFFSLDVEGYELEVLKGMDFEACPVQVFAIESERPAAVVEALSATHRLVETIGNDHLFVAL